MPINECCGKPENLEVIKWRKPEGEGAGAMVVRQCKSCKRKHYEMSADAPKKAGS